MIRQDDIAVKIMSILEHRQNDWEEYLAWWEGGNEPYNDMSELAGYVLDEIVYEMPLAKPIADLLEQLFLQADDRAKEILSFGLLEDLNDFLHGVWDKEGLYQQKQTILLKYLGKNTRKFFLDHEAEKIRDKEGKEQKGKLPGSEPST